MKGVVFNILADMVEETAGLEVWNDIVEQVSPSKGAYTAAQSYSDEELFALVAAVCDKLQIPREDAIRAFGQFMFGQLASRYPVFVEQQPDLISFLKSVDSVIHVEVEKLYSSPHLPEFQYSEPRPGKLVMHYHSERKLCFLAEGLILGAAEHYGSKIELNHPVCMHQGADHCELEVEMIS